MDSPKMDLAALYREAYRVGEALLTMLEKELPEEQAGEWERLLGERESLAARAEERLAAGERSHEALMALQALLRQQEKLDRAFNGRLQAVAAELAAATRSKSVLTSTGRLLRPGGRSRMLDTYR